MNEALSTHYMAGTCTGTLKSGVRYHAVPGPVENGALPKALCGRKPSIIWSDACPGQPVTCPACLRALKRRPQPMLAGQDGLEPVQPSVGLVAFTTYPESGELEQVELVRRAPAHDFDGHPAWAWRWLTGPSTGKTAVAYGRTFWRKA